MGANICHFSERSNYVLVSIMNVGNKLYTMKMNHTFANHFETHKYLKTSFLLSATSMLRIFTLIIRLACVTLLIRLTDTARYTEGSRITDYQKTNK